MYYHGARYYIPWLCRWTAVDPMEAKFAGMSPYNYAFNNPVIFNDPSGMEGEAKGGSSLWYEYKTAENKYGYKYGSSIEDIQKSEKYKSFTFTGKSFSTHSYTNVHGGETKLFSDGTFEETYAPSSSGLLGEGSGLNIWQAAANDGRSAEAFAESRSRGAAAETMIKTQFAIGGAVAIGVVAVTAAPVAIGSSQLISALSTESATVGRAGIEGLKWVVNKYAKDAAIKSLNSWAQNDFNWSKVDKFDLTLSILNPAKKYGLGSKIFIEGISSAIDIKEGKISSILPTDFTGLEQKNISDAAVDYSSGLSKFIIKGLVEKEIGKSKILDNILDYTMGKLKKNIKSNLKETKNNFNENFKGI